MTVTGSVSYQFKGKCRGHFEESKRLSWCRSAWKKWPQKHKYKITNRTVRWWEDVGSRTCYPDEWTHYLNHKKVNYSVSKKQLSFVKRSEKKEYPRRVAFTKFIALPMNMTNHAEQMLWISILRRIKAIKDHEMVIAVEEFVRIIEDGKALAILI